VGTRLFASSGAAKNNKKANKEKKEEEPADPEDMSHVVTVMRLANLGVSVAIIIASVRCVLVAGLAADIPLDSVSRLLFPFALLCTDTPSLCPPLYNSGIQHSTNHSPSSMGTLLLRNSPRRNVMLLRNPAQVHPCRNRH